MDLEKLHTQSIRSIAHTLRNRRVRVRELTEYCIARHEEFGGTLNAYIKFDAAGARAAADAIDQKNSSSDSQTHPMYGIPVSIKDIYGVPHLPIYAGSKRQLPHKWQAPGPIVADLINQNAIIMGKTHTVEFAYGGLGVNNHWGTPVNPWDSQAHRVPGGSSSGAGVSLCEGSALTAFGTDTAGSVRIPASFTGNAGLKSTYGSLSTQGIVPLSPYLDTAGALTRNAEDAAYVYAAVHPEIEGLKGVIKFCDSVNALRSMNFTIGLPGGMMWDCAFAGIAAVCTRAIDALDKAGCKILPIDHFADAETAIALRNAGGSTSVELIEFLQAELPDWIDELDPVIRERIKIGGDISAVELLRRFRKTDEARSQVLRHFRNCDVIASPTVVLSPPLMDEVCQPADYMPKNLLALQNTGIVSYLNLCALTVPVGLDDLGLPVGLQLIGPPKSEVKLLAIGQRLESLVEKPLLNR